MSDVSPKVAVPALVLAVLGFAGIALGLFTDEGTLVEVGGGLLAASGLTGGVGYRVKDPRRRITPKRRSK